MKNEELKQRLSDINKKARYLLSGEALNFNEVFEKLEEIEKLSEAE